ncbi:MAG: hypothetical protein DHS20C14_18510 [Phycisphaeraceae bacterium]|nr:MAG: hypothetical protein DHS20C14_18510 [Phycisphaeraceae bacterium]
MSWREAEASRTPRTQARARPSTGSRIPIKSAMIATTTSNSISVKAGRRDAGIGGPWGALGGLLGGWVGARFVGREASSRPPQLQLRLDRNFVASSGDKA